MTLDIEHLDDATAPMRYAFDPSLGESRVDPTEGWTSLSDTARFRAAPRLASLLGESYRSSEQALRELHEGGDHGARNGHRGRHRESRFAVGEDVHGRKLLLEFKRPKALVGREAERQAKEYRDELTRQFGHMHTPSSWGGEPLGFYWLWRNFPKTAKDAARRSRNQREGEQPQMDADGRR